MYRVGPVSNAWLLGWRGGRRVEPRASDMHIGTGRSGAFPFRSPGEAFYSKSDASVGSDTEEEVGVAGWTAGRASLCARQKRKKLAGGVALAVTRWRFRVSLSQD
jgi:hypothetical protein